MYCCRTVDFWATHIGFVHIFTFTSVMTNQYVLMGERDRVLSAIE